MVEDSIWHDTFNEMQSDILEQTRSSSCIQIKSFWRIFEDLKHGQRLRQSWLGKLEMCIRYRGKDWSSLVGRMFKFHVTTFIEQMKGSFCVLAIHNSIIIFEPGLLIYLEQSPAFLQKNGRLAGMSYSSTLWRMWCCTAFLIYTFMYAQKFNVSIRNGPKKQEFGKWYLCISLVWSIRKNMDIKLSMLWVKLRL